MPIYEYHCKDCRTDHEVLVRTSREKIACPRCGSHKLAKKLSVFAPAKDSPDPAPQTCSGNPRSCGRCAT
jgi:putative FmdB family regulatory protein